MKIIHFNNYVSLISVNMSQKLYIYFLTDIAIECYDTAMHTITKKMELNKKQQTCEKNVHKK